MIKLIKRPRKLLKWLFSPLIFLSKRYVNSQKAFYALIATIVTFGLIDWLRSKPKLRKYAEFIDILVTISLLLVFIVQILTGVIYLINHGLAFSINSMYLYLLTCFATFKNNIWDIIGFTYNHLHNKFGYENSWLLDKILKQMGNRDLPLTKTVLKLKAELDKLNEILKNNSITYDSKTGTINHPWKIEPFKSPIEPASDTRPVYNPEPIFDPKRSSPGIQINIGKSS